MDFANPGTFTLRDAYRFAATNNSSQINVLADSYKQFVIEPIFENSTGLRIYDTSFENGVFNLGSNKNLLSKFSDDIFSRNWSKKRIEILLNEEPGKEVFNFFRMSPFLIEMAHIRLINNVYPPVIIGDDNKILIKRSDKNHFIYSFNSPKYAGSLIPFFDKESSSPRKAFL